MLCECTRCLVTAFFVSDRSPIVVRIFLLPTIAKDPLDLPSCLVIRNLDRSSRRSRSPPLLPLGPGLLLLLWRLGLRLGRPTLGVSSALLGGWRLRLLIFGLRVRVCLAPLRPFLFIAAEELLCVFVVDLLLHGHFRQLGGLVGRQRLQHGGVARDAGAFTAPLGVGHAPPHKMCNAVPHSCSSLCETRGQLTIVDARLGRQSREQLRRPSESPRPLEAGWQRPVRV
eukprot:scaffold7495_cov200-Pinguiococcus_pyrenoidosus.AAC.1